MTGTEDAKVREVYRERAHLVAFVAACYPSVQCPDPDDPDYRLVYVSTLAGQLSWHITAEDANDLLGHVPSADSAEWDGHTTTQKYERLDEITARIARSGGIAGVVAAASGGAS